MTAQNAQHARGMESAKAAHVNVMTDTIIANLPPEALRSVIRSLLGIDAKVTPAFHDLTLKYLSSTKPATTPVLFETSAAEGPAATNQFYDFQARYRCLMGCGQAFETLEALSEAFTRFQSLKLTCVTNGGKKFRDVLASMDSDLVQAMTAVQKVLITSSGIRPMSSNEAEAMRNLRKVLVSCQSFAASTEVDFLFQRGLSRLEMLLGEKMLGVPSSARSFTASKSNLETIVVGNAVVPRMFMGLWQFSSPAWGIASRSNIDIHFRKHVDAGFIAYGKYISFVISKIKSKVFGLILSCSRHGRPLR